MHKTVMYNVTKSYKNVHLLGFSDGMQQLCGKRILRSRMDKCGNWMKHKKIETELTIEGVDPSGHPLYNCILYFSPSYALDAQILEAATEKSTTQMAMKS